MLDRASVPRRALDFEDYISILKRNFRWILGPLFAGLVISTVVAYIWPDTYISEALIRIVPQQISTQVVPDITAQDITDRINGMAQSIESHNTLSTIITSFNLYAKELKNAPLEDVLTQMKKDIKIKPIEGVTNVTGKELPAMQVGFAYRDASTAQKVCADIVSRFTDASARESLSIQTQANQFLTEQFEQTRQALNAIDQKLADFKSKNNGRVPDELQNSMAQMTMLQQRSGSASDAIGRNAEQRTVLESGLEMAKERLKAAEANSPRSQAQSQRVAELDREISALETSVASMKNEYTDNYPDLQTARDRLKVLRQQRADAFKEQPKDDSNSAENASISRDRLEAQNAVKQYQAQLEANAMEAKRLQVQNGRVNQAIAAYQSSLESLPAGQKEYGELMRDRELTKQRYDQLDLQRQRSIDSIKLNERKQGESLELLDSASLPSSPSQPKRYVIIPAGAVVGLIIGLVIIGMREMRDVSLKSLKDARLYTQLPVLGSVPLLENAVLVQRRKQKLWVGWAAASFVGLAIMALSVVHYYTGKT